MKSLPIDQKKLKELSRLCRHHNVAPLFLNHYINKDSKNPVDKLGTELSNEVSDLLHVASEKEIEDLISYFPRHLQSIVSRNSGESPDFEVLSFSYLIYELLQFKFPLSNVIEQDLGQSEIIRTYPELIELLDQDKLITIDERFEFTFDGLIYKDHLLFFHQFFRRGYSGNHNVDFLHRFGKYYSNSKEQNKFRIALDHNRIMRYEFYQRTLEFDMWYGCTFTSDQIDDPKQLGMTVVKRNEFYPYDLNKTLDRTEFLWTLKNQIKIFQAEEVSNLSYSFNQFYLNKYVHSERNITAKQLTHFDGAVKVYLIRDYNVRFESDLKGNSKSHRKVKLFRIDGNIELEEWIKLISFFYRGNEMIVEYFDPEQYEDQFGKAIEANRLFLENEKADNKY